LSGNGFHIKEQKYGFEIEELKLKISGLVLVDEREDSIDGDVL
jgi:hypothetical protein